MSSFTQKFVEVGHASLATFKRYGAVSLEGYERFADLNVESVKVALDEAVKNGNALLAVKDVQELIGLQTAIAELVAEKALAHSRSVYQIASQTQAEFNKLVEEHFEDFNKEVIAALDEALKHAPAGSIVAVEAVKSAMAAANTAYDTMSKAAKQVAEIAGANVTAITSTPRAPKKKAA